MPVMTRKEALRADLFHKSLALWSVHIAYLISSHLITSPPFVRRRTIEICFTENFLLFPRE